MSSILILTMAVAISCVFADPNPDAVVAAASVTGAVVAPLTAASLVAPAAITARSYQVFARNYNALTAPLIAASPFVAASPVAAPLLANAASLPAPLIAGAPIVAAEASPVVQSRTLSTKTEKSTLEPSRNGQPARSAVQAGDVESRRDLSPRSNNVASAAVVAASPAAASRTAVVSAPVAPLHVARQSVIAAPAAIYPGAAAYTAAAYTSYPAGVPVVASPYFSSAFSTSNFVRFN